MRINRWNQGYPGVEFAEQKLGRELSSLGLHDTEGGVAVCEYIAARLEIESELVNES